MNLAEYQIALTVRLRIPLDVEPPPEVVTTGPDGLPRVELSDLDSDTYAVVLEKLAAAIGSRSDRTHVDVVDSLIVHGKKLAARHPEAIVEITHVNNVIPPQRIEP